MSKRPAEEAADAEDRHHASTKRVKQERRPKTKSRKSTEISSPQELQEILQFHQNALQDLRSGLQSLRGFLKLIAKGEEQVEGGRLSRSEILLQFLQAQRTPGVGEDRQATLLSGLMQAWSFAAYAHEDSLLSVLPGCLALLLETISSKIDFRELGALLCTTLLDYPQLKLLSRGTSAGTSKPHLVSPCLWLLTELATFDGGAFTRRLYARREFAFKALARNLGQYRDPEPEDEKHKPVSLRINAVRFVLANLKYLDANEKSDLVGYRDIITALIKDTANDPPDVAVSILDAFRDHVFLDREMPSRAKGKLLSEWSLKRLAQLYDYDQYFQYPEEQGDGVIDRAHQLLLRVCTDPEAGILRPEQGWYGDRDEERLRTLNPNISVSRYAVAEDYAQKTASVRNNALAVFCTSLRPYADPLQKELLLAIFKAAPELVAAYYDKMSNFSFDPKLSLPWIGYASFIYSTTNLPVPRHFGSPEMSNRIPPSTSVAMENILPRPLDTKTITRCLNQTSPLVTQFALRILIRAFEKLRKVLSLYERKASKGEHLYHAAVEHLKGAFARKCPTIKDLTPAFRSIPESNLLQRIKFAQLISLYYQVLPEVALEDKFDISVVLSKSLQSIGLLETRTEVYNLRLSELRYLLEIAARSSDIRWFAKPDGSTLSTYTAMLQLLCSDQKIPLRRLLLHLLWRLSTEFSILSSSPNVLMALISSLSGLKKSESVFTYFNHCIAQFVQRPAKYYDDVARERKPGHGPADVPSLILAVIVEQWDFYAQAHDIDEKKAVLLWIATVLKKFEHVGDLPASSKFHQRLVGFAKSSELKPRYIGKIFASPTDVPLDDLETSHVNGVAEDDASSETSLEDEAPDLEVESSKLMKEPDVRVLTRIIRKEIELALEDGDVAEVIMCLSSSELSVRKQALISIAKAVQAIEASHYDEKHMTGLLLEEVYHSAKSVISKRRFPTFLCVFAVKSLEVERQPDHFLYGKISNFLTERPVWDADKVPLVQRILLHPPDVETAHYEEVRWLLDLLIKGLHTEQDMDVYRHSHLFERFLALQTSPALPSDIRASIDDLIVRAVGVNDGSTTLVTRTGILSYLRSRAARERSKGASGRKALHLIKLLASRWDKDRVDSWTDGSVQKFLDVALKDLE